MHFQEIKKKCPKQIYFLEILVFTIEKHHSMGKCEYKFVTRRIIPINVTPLSRFTILTFFPDQPVELCSVGRDSSNCLQYFALPELPGAMEATLCFSLTIECPSSVSSLRLNKSGIYGYVVRQLTLSPIWFRIMYLHSVFCAFCLWRLLIDLIFFVLRLQKALSCLILKVDTVRIAQINNQHE